MSLILGGILWANFFLLVVCFLLLEVLKVLKQVLRATHRVQDEVKHVDVTHEVTAEHADVNANEVTVNGHG